MFSTEISEQEKLSSGLGINRWCSRFLWVLEKYRHLSFTKCFVLGWIVEFTKARNYIGRKYNGFCRLYVDLSCHFSFINTIRLYIMEESSPYFKYLKKIFYDTEFPSKNVLIALFLFNHCY